MPDRDFPKVPDHREASDPTVECAVLREMIERTMFSICDDETRFHLNDVFFESGGSKCRMVSTDGHRLSKIERTIPNGPKLSAGVIGANPREPPGVAASPRSRGWRPRRAGAVQRGSRSVAA